MYRKKIFFSLFVLLVFVFLNIDLWQGYGTTQVFRDPDEAWYGIVLKSVASEGCAGVPISYQFKDRFNFHSCQFMRVINSTLPIKNIITQTVTLKFISRFILILAFGFFYFLVFKDAILGLLLGLCLFLDGGIYVFKPGIITIQNLLTGHLDEFIRTNRYMSPMQYQVPLLLWTMIYVNWLFLIQGDRRRIDIVLFITTLGLGVLIAITPFYAWSTYLLTTFWFLVFSWSRCSRARWYLAFTSFVVTAILSLLISFSKTQIPFVQDVLVRSGFFNDQWSPLFMLDKGLILGMLILSFLIYKLSKKRILSFLVPVSFYLFVNINVFTGKEYQNFHFKDYLGPMWFISLIFMATLLFKNKKNIIYGLLIFLSSLGLFQHVISQTGRQSVIFEEESRIETQKILTFFKVHPKQKVYCSEFYQTLPLMTDVKCSWHHLLMTYPLSNEEVLDQSMAQWRLSGRSEEQVKEWISMDASPARSLGVWSHGILPAWSNTSLGAELYSVKNLQEHIIPLWMATYKLFDVDQAIKKIGNADFYILPLSFANQQSQFEAVATFSNFGIYKIKK